MFRVVTFEFRRLKVEEVEVKPEPLTARFEEVVIMPVALIVPEVERLPVAGATEKLPPPTVKLAPVTSRPEAVSTLPAKETWEAPVWERVEEKEAGPEAAREPAILTPDEKVLMPETPRVPARLTLSSRLTVTVSVAVTTVPILVPPIIFKVSPWTMVSEPVSPETVRRVPPPESAAQAQPVVSLVYFKM